jgi:MOSC domain-containing protein YiiM/ferredoxin-NADP reductase
MTMARLLSINVGLPRDVDWRGRKVHTAIWKAPVEGRRMVRRINIDGDGQGDLQGHGGENRAVYVYQIDAYHYWEERLGRSDFTYGQLGENFTIEGLPDDEVCIGDRYRIGGALFEVSQPRVTCYRVGIRMNEPRMAALLTGSGKPGFYLRVLEEGEVGAGDEIIKAGEEQERMTVAEINAMLYLGDHPREKLERALRLKALSAGWRGSFEALLQSESARTGAAGAGAAGTGAGGTGARRAGGAGGAGASGTLAGGTGARRAGGADASGTLAGGTGARRAGGAEVEATAVGGIGIGAAGGRAEGEGAAGSRGTGNAALVPAAAAHTAKPGFRSLSVARIEREAVDVISFELEPSGDGPLGMPLPGQFIVLRLHTEAEGLPLYRSYSLSALPSSEQYRISVKIEPHGAAGAYLSTRVQAGHIIDASEPRGSFVLLDGDGPVVLASAGIGVTPVLAILHALAATASPREIWWLHGSRNGKSHPFALESQRLVRQLPHCRSHILYSKPDPDDRLGQDFDAAGHLDMTVLDQLGVPQTGDFYICGPGGFMHDLTTGLAAAGVAAARIHTEIFAGLEAITPGIAAGTRRAPHLPDGSPGTGPLVSFARSGIAVRWAPSTYNSLLEVAEACDVPVRWACRTGVCHTCESGLVSGSVAYDPEPLDPAADGNVLICCSQPQGDVVIDI